MHLHSLSKAPFFSCPDMHRNFFQVSLNYTTCRPYEQMFLCQTLSIVTGQNGLAHTLREVGRSFGVFPHSKAATESTGGTQ